MSWIPFVLLIPLLEPADPTLELANSEPDHMTARQFDMGFEAAFFTTYVFRGEPQYPSASIPSFQPSMWFNFGNSVPGELRMNLWSAFAMCRREWTSERGNASEVDLSITYENAILDEWLVLGGAFIYNLYPGEEPTDGEKEFMLDIGVGNLPITLSVAFFLEVHPTIGVYFEPRFGWAEQYRNMTVEFFSTIGASIYKDREFSVDHTTFTTQLTHTMDTLKFGINVSYSLRIAPSGLSFLDRSLVYGGVMIAYSP